MSVDQLNLKIEFGGGLELLFSNQRTHAVSLPSRVNLGLYKGETAKEDTSDGRHPDMRFLLSWLKVNLLKEREELFLDGDTVLSAKQYAVILLTDIDSSSRRPGILVLINDTDWELEGEGEYVLKDGDEIVLISTLHGG